MQLSNSKAKTFRRCPKKYEFRYPMKLRPKAKAIPLEKGSWCHALLQTHYEGKDWKKAHKQLHKEFRLLPDWIREELGNLPLECARIMRGYLRQYPDDLRRYRVIDAETDEVITLPNGLRFQIIVDLILEDLLEGGLCFWDHKFRNKFGDPDDMMLDPQLTLYFWGLERMGFKDMRYGLYNEIRTAVPKVPKVLVRGGLSKSLKIDTDVYTYQRAIQEHDLDPTDYAEILQHIATNEDARFFRRTPIPKDIPVLKTTMKELVDTAIEIQRAEKENRYPRSFDTSCKYQCEYKGLCIAQLHGGDISSMIKQDFEVSKRG